MRLYILSTSGVDLCTMSNEGIVATRCSLSIPAHSACKVVGEHLVEVYSKKIILIRIEGEAGEPHKIRGRVNEGFRILRDRLVAS